MSTLIEVSLEDAHRLSHLPSGVLRHTVEGWERWYRTSSGLWCARLSGDPLDPTTRQHRSFSQGCLPRDGTYYGVGVRVQVNDGQDTTLEEIV